MSQAARWLRPGARVLDIGCHHGEFFEYAGQKIGSGIGIDPLAPPLRTDRWELRAIRFEDRLPFDDASFDAIVSLATFEHLGEHDSIARECWRLITPGGRVIVTVPQPMVDRIVDLLVMLRLADGMSLEEHHGFEPSVLPGIFASAGFEFEHHGRFQLGLNNIFVFRKA